MSQRDHHDALIEQLLREILGGDRPRDLTQRVMAQAYANDRTRRWWWTGSAGAIAAALAVAAIIYAMWYPAMKAGPQIAVVGGNGRVERAAHLVNDSNDTGNLELGGYVSVAVAPDTLFSVGGSPHNEKLFLENGHVDVSVVKRVGNFDVVVGAATVHVTGTKFSVDVAAADASGDADGGERMLTVAVKEGSVRIDGSGMTSAVTLKAGGPPEAFAVWDDLVKTYNPSSAEGIGATEIMPGNGAAATPPNLEASSHPNGVIPNPPAAGNIGGAPEAAPGAGSTPNNTTSRGGSSPPPASPGNTTQPGGIKLNGTPRQRSTRVIYHQVPVQHFEQVGHLRYGPYTLVTDTSLYLLGPVPPNFNMPAAGSLVRVTWNGGKLATIEKLNPPASGPAAYWPGAYRRAAGRPNFSRGAMHSGH